MAGPRITRTPVEVSRRRKAIYLLAGGVTLLFAMIVSQASFDLGFLNPDSNQQIAVFAGLSALIFLLFVSIWTVNAAEPSFELTARYILEVVKAFRTAYVLKVVEHARDGGK